MNVPRPLEPLDVRVADWLARYAITFTRLSLGVVFLWFGALKFVPGGSPAEDLARRTVGRLTPDTVPDATAYLILAAWEVAIGLGLLSGRLLRVTLALLVLQMAGTMLPLVFFPAETFRVIPFIPTLEGQYIIKNLVLVGAALVIGATVRRGYVFAKPPLDS
jgi:uncharacterized membrane protein YkgB